MPAVRIPAQRSTWLGFDLGDVMAAVGEHAELKWQVLDANLAFEDEPVSDAWQAVAFDSRLEGGVDVTWEQMEALAAAGGQVVQGAFTGFDGNEAIVQLAAFRPTHWTVWARHGATLERVRGAFLGVDDCDVRVPRR
ncbi:MAG: hypothetical protein JO085_03260 [Acidimicrobiia bacterium]|nr:hypothetical protein [Acidimicrobiia bacterium]